jgi:hypothetical protein
MARDSAGAPLPHARGRPDPAGVNLRRGRRGRHGARAARARAGGAGAATQRLPVVARYHGAMYAPRGPWSSLAIALAVSGCALGYRGRIDSAEQRPSSVSAQFLYVDQLLAGVTVTSANLRDSVSSEGRSQSRWGVPVGVRVLDTSPDGVDDRWELWPFAGGIRDGGAWGFDAGLHVRYQRAAYGELGAQRTFGEHGDTQLFVGIGLELSKLAICGCVPF